MSYLKVRKIKKKWIIWQSGIDTNVIDIMEEYV